MSSLEWMPDLAAALDESVPLEDSSRADWDDVVARTGKTRMVSRVRRRRPHWSLRLAIVVALIFLLLGCAATVTYLLLRGDSGLTFPGVDGALLIVGPNGSERQAGPVCSKWKPGDITGCGVGEPAWSPDGTRLAFVAGKRSLGGLGLRRSDHKSNSLYVATADGTGVRRLARCGLCGELSDSNLAWSPNGRWIVFSVSAHHQSSFWESLWIAGSAGGRPHRLTHCNRCVDARPAWSPNGRLLLFQRAIQSAPRGDSLYTVRPDGSRLTKIKSNAADPAWSPDGHEIAYDKITLPRRKHGALFWDQGGIEVVEANGSHPRLLTPERWRRSEPLDGPGRWAQGPSLSYPNWSPDGRKLLFLQTVRRAVPHGGYREKTWNGGPREKTWDGGYREEIWTMNADGSDKKRLYQSVWGQVQYAPPIWSPDGQMIAFATVGPPKIVRISKKNLRHLRSFEVMRVGTKVIPIKAINPYSGIFVMNADGTDLKRVSPNIWPQLAWQPQPKGKN
jgi:Tol biopolymer transport system component